MSAALYVEIAGAASVGYEWGELGWTLEDNRPVNLGIKMMGGEIYKQYRLYEKSLGRSHRGALMLFIVCKILHVIGNVMWLGGGAAAAFTFVLISREDPKVRLAGAQALRKIILRLVSPGMNISLWRAWSCW